MKLPATVLKTLIWSALVCAQFAPGQSLQQKSMARNVYGEDYFSNMSQRQRDSLKAVYAGGGTSQNQAVNEQGQQAGKQLNVLDSLLMGPRVLLDSSGQDSLNNPDSIPKRFSQRIFKRSPGHLFSAANSALGKSHILSPGDEVTISLWGDKEKVYSLQLNESGKIFLEGVGLINLNGLSLGAAESVIRKKLSKIYSGINRGTSFVELSSAKASPIRVFVLGEVMLPGGYTFSSNTSVLSALYSAKGPTDLGTVRNIKLTRGDSSYYLDLYEYLLKGNILSPHTLEDGDILFAARADVLAEISGDVGRPAVYELKKGEGIKELLEYAGRINPTSANQNITLKRYFDDGRPDIIDLKSPKFYSEGSENYLLEDGDSLWVDTSSEKSQNFIQVTGPVKYPGVYEAANAKNVEELIKSAGGLKEDAYLSRIHVLRFNPDGSSKLFSYAVDNNKIKDIALEGKDNVVLYSIRDMYEPDSVEIAGAVHAPGKYPFHAGMSAKDLVLKAGGFLRSREEGKAICFRGEGNTRKITNMEIKLQEGLKNTGEEFKLSSTDFILIPEDPNWYQQEYVTLAGQFKYPGKYALLFPEEQLAAVIKRAGGFKSDAYIPGFRFFRKKNEKGRIGINLEKALNAPNSLENISLKDGDSLHLPEREMSVKVIGEVGLPTSVLFKKGKGVKYYISRAGGYTRFSDKKHVVLEYANGEIAGDGDFYRDPDPGSVIYVPGKPEAPPVEWLKGIDAIVGTMAGAAALILSILIIDDKINN